MTGAVSKPPVCKHGEPLPHEWDHDTGREVGLDTVRVERCNGPPMLSPFEEGLERLHSTMDMLLREARCTQFRYNVISVPDRFSEREPGSHAQLDDVHIGLTHVGEDGKLEPFLELRFKEAADLLESLCNSGDKHVAEALRTVQNIMVRVGKEAAAQYE